MAALALILPIPIWLPVTAAISDPAARITIGLRRKGRPSNVVNPFIVRGSLIHDSTCR